MGGGAHRSLSFESINEEYTKWAKQNGVGKFRCLTHDSWLDLDLEQEYDDVLARFDELDISVCYIKTLLFQTK